jgi:hypothetical protein
MVVFQMLQQQQQHIIMEVIKKASECVDELNKDSVIRMSL